MPSQTMSMGGPPQGRGYYEPDTGRWWDNDLESWLPAGSGVDTLEVTVEEVDLASWRKRLVPKALRGPDQPRFRFVAHAWSADARWPAYRVEGAAFTLSEATFTVGDADAEPRADVAQRRLSRLAGFLFERGWQPEDHGEHWWSLRLSRPHVQWPDEVSGGVRVENMPSA